MRRRPPPSRTRALASARPIVWCTAALLLSGCDSCSRDRPYTPFGVGSVVAPTTASSAIPGKAAGFEATPAAEAPEHAIKWRLGGMKLDAPDGYRFELGLTADFDEDQHLDAVAWVVPDEAAARPATVQKLLFYAGSPNGAGKPRSVMERPAHVPAGPGCTLDARLWQSGPHTVTLDVASRCEAELIERAPTRGLAVVAPARKNPTILALRLADPAPGEQLEPRVESVDLDGDGRDDVTLTISLSSGDAERAAEARLAWLDRAAGASRDASEPAKSFADLASLEVVRSKGLNTSRGVFERVENARRLYASLCSEGQTPRVFDSKGAPIPCGDLSLAFDRLARAELLAALTQSKLLHAFSVLTRDGWYGEEIGKETRKALVAELLSAVEVRPIDDAVVPDARPRARGSRPRWSPLWFEATGKLLIQTPDGIYRNSGKTRDVEDASDEVDPWPLLVTTEEGRRLDGIGMPCNRSELVLLLADARGAPASPEPVDLLSPRPGRCGQGKATAFDPRVRAVDWSTSEPVNQIAGALVGAPEPFTRKPPVPGSPRSPDGIHTITVTPLGLLITGNAKPELWQGGGLEPYPDLSDCVVANGASAAACVQRGGVVVVKPG